MFFGTPNRSYPGFSSSSDGLQLLLLLYSDYYNIPYSPALARLQFKTNVSV